MSDLRTKILCRTYYEEEIEKIHQSLIIKNKLYRSVDDDIQFSLICYERYKVAKLLVKDIRRQVYKPQPASLSIETVNGKKREFFRFSVVDRIFHGVLSRIFMEDFKETISPNVFSYISGRSWQDAVSKFAAYVRRHVKSCKDPKRRGLYVLRHDIADYTDSIPVGERAAIWNIIKQHFALDTEDDPFDRYLWALIQSVVRPEIEEKEAKYSRIIGIPTGSPISAILYNLCGSTLDSLCCQVEGAFYARYSDDFIFAHPSADVVKEIEKKICEVLAEQKLRINENKSKILYFNGACRISNEWPEAAATVNIEFLGCSVDFRGEVSLSQKKTRRLLRSLRRRISRTIECAGEQGHDLVRLICKVVNDSLVPDTRALFAEKSAKFLGFIATNRKFLKEIDYLICLMVAEELSGVRGVRSFRHLPPHELREKWGLQSLYFNRNLAGKEK